MIFLWGLHAKFLSYITSSLAGAEANADAKHPPLLLKLLSEQLKCDGMRSYLFH